jgi:hypothetical protein
MTGLFQLVIETILLLQVEDGLMKDMSEAWRDATHGIHIVIENRGFVVIAVTLAVVTPPIFS